MPRRVNLPRADDLFPRGEEPSRAVGSSVRAVPDTHEETTEPTTAEEQRRKAASGRVRHDEKMTVYVTSEELLEIEQARLTLRSGHRLAVDRGRLVREALAIVLADLEQRGADSLLVDRLHRD